MKKGLEYTGVCVVFFCHDGKGNYLLNKRSKNCRDEHGCWDPGGGGVEFGESVINTLKNEISQEYCAEVLEYEFLGYRDVHRIHEKQKTHWIALDFRVHIDRSQVRNGEPHKFDELKWFRLDSLPDTLHSQFAAALDAYRKKLV